MLSSLPIQCPYAGEAIQMFASLADLDLLTVEISLHKIDHGMHALLVNVLVVGSSEH